ncbi:MAG TPA: transcriptional regulator [Lachnoclostridium sp.]|uniref:GyrI-like domain-containing protein n=1 Tax=Lacrimispora celerecrescens TaxID=29354 RepID=UPI000E9E0E91|nr:GyrI-like domain-containing protein [Lacrimispora celerecrescens]HBE84843.1 transcriptional regulator [Lachnoclostridium sp.]
MAIDFKKIEKDLYQPGAKPAIIEVPEMTFIMIDGHGDPNTSEAYQTAIEVLYGLAYTVKMSKTGGRQLKGYYDFVVPPLEGLWSTDTSVVETGITDKNAFCWTSMMRMPEFVTPEVFEEVKIHLSKKKPSLDSSIARLEVFTEGLCAQVMHTGSYDSEPATIHALKTFVAESGYRIDLSDKRKHHELYLNDPRKTSPEKLKTIIRYPIIK